METVNHETYVSLEVAKLLKDAGFDWGTFSHWTESDTNNSDFKFSGLSDKPILYDGHTPIDEDACIGRKKDWNNYNNECPLIYNYSAPTLDVAQQWLREVKNCYAGVEVFVHDLDKNNIYYTYNWVVYFNGDRYSGSDYDTTRYYEVAQEASIKKTLKLILAQK